MAPLNGADGARALMRLSMLDWTVNAIAARREGAVPILAARARDDGGAAQATLLGGGRGPATMAARLNATAARALDYTDTHVALLDSPSVAVIGAALATAERQGAALGAVVDAAVIGAEAVLRIGQWLGPAHHQAGFETAATAGTFGATLAAGRVLGLTAADMRGALSLAAARASGLRWQSASMAAPLSIGLAAETGVDCALLARAGLRSHTVPGVIGGPLGFGPAFRGGAIAGAFDGLGQVWQFEAVEHRFHACGHGLHATIEAIAAFQLDPARVAAMSIHVSPRWIGICDNPAPRTGFAARYSLSHAAAMVMAGVDTANPASFSDAAVQDPQLIALRDRVTISHDPALTEVQARLRITMKSGQVLTASHDLAEAPRTFVQRRDRLMTKARALIGEEARAVSDAIMHDSLPGLTATLTRAHVG